MRKVKYLIVAISALLTLAMNADAASSKDKLVSLLYQQQKDTEKQIVAFWTSNRRGDELNRLIEDYVVREVRLQTMSGKDNTRTLYSEVTKNGDVSFKSMDDLAKAIVREHFKREGLELDKVSFVQGDYLIRKKCIQKPDNENVSWKD